MPIQIVHGDITKITCDAIVNAANTSLLGGGGVDGCIHRAAGPELLSECRTLGGCETGSAKITGGYRLPCRYVIHTPGPIWRGGKAQERELLISCYRSSLALAKEYGCETVAFPLISAGAYGYPKDEALRIAVDTVCEFLLENDMTVFLTVFDKSSFVIDKKVFSDISALIDSAFPTKAPLDCEAPCKTRFFGKARGSVASLPLKNSLTDAAMPTAVMPDLKETFCVPSNLQNALDQIDESFSEMLLRKIDEKGMTDAECYKKANIDRKLFSKIRGDTGYRPSKQTAIAFSIALELPIEEARDFLRKAGFALSRSNKFDIIIEYFIVNKNYNIFEINEALFTFDQVLLGV